MSHGYPTPPRAEERRVLGHPVPRIEDRPLVTGHGLYAGDVSFPHQLHMRIVRSAHAHARIVAIDTAAARALPGVVAVWTVDDIAELPPIDFRDPSAEALKPYRQPVLARGRVRYVGDPVAAVFAEDPYVAEDAADLVDIEVAPLPVLMGAQELGEFDDGRATEPTIVRHSFGDIEAAFAKAHAVVELDLTIGRHSGVPMETRGAIGRYDAARDVLELHGAAKVPHRNKDTLVRMLGRSPHSLHLFEGHTGGGFGIRGELYPEDVLVLVAALRLGRPVKWIEDRREHLISANHSRHQHHRVRAAVDPQGRLLGMEDEFFHDQGAYVRTHGARVVGRTMSMLTGPYKVGAYRAVGHFRLTNKTPAATYRAPGRYEGTFVRERLMDAIAARLGIDRIELRRRNLIPGAEMPFTVEFDEPGAEELVLDSGDYPALLDKALAHFKWDQVLADVTRRRAAGEAVGTGIGLFVEESGRGPADGAKISVDTDGAVEVVTGGASVGQGFATAMAQICAEQLGVDYSRIRVVHGRTDRIAFGIGAHAARATVMTGGAVNETAIKLRQKALQFASELLQTPAEMLDIVDGVVRRKGGDAGPSIALGDIAKRVAPGAELLHGREPGLSAEAWFHTDHTVFPYGAQLAVVRVDRDTGQATVERLMIAYDVGRAVNPMMLEGQLVGGSIQGVGGALLEEFTYDQNGEPLAVTFADYLMPSLRDAPPVDVLITEDAPSPRNPLGLKGGGEGGINAVGAVIAGAIDDAIGIPGAVTRLPVTPPRLKELLRRGAP
ncbi:MAG TPA: xanthine dehydrogenase family protein molybdopterin-binding subunit [Xanthobacteraceae bacterium]|jgi:CO/xanthine dehydrogenase Mo-binding subunit|nr:xanthine dehydrogenase family protein molybdopterin-binding subunit [Xanthobacteraceae bacterium]